MAVRHCELLSISYTFSLAFVKQFILRRLYGLFLF